MGANAKVSSVIGVVELKAGACTIVGVPVALFLDRTSLVGGECLVFYFFKADHIVLCVVKELSLMVM